MHASFGKSLNTKAIAQPIGLFHASMVVMLLMAAGCGKTDLADDRNGSGGTSSSDLQLSGSTLSGDKTLASDIPNHIQNATTDINDLTTQCAKLAQELYCYDQSLAELSTDLANWDAQLATDTANLAAATAKLGNDQSGDDGKLVSDETAYHTANVCYNTPKKCASFGTAIATYWTDLDSENPVMYQLEFGLYSAGDPFMVSYVNAAITAALKSTYSAQAVAALKANVTADEATVAQDQTNITQSQAAIATDNKQIQNNANAAGLPTFTLNPVMAEVCQLVQGSTSTDCNAWQ